VNETEVRLQRDLEAAGGRVKRLGPDMLLLEGVPTDPERFSKPATNLLVVCTHAPRMPYLVLVDEDLAYGGPDPFLAGVFSDQPKANGWRPLLLAPDHLTQGHPADVARAALRFLGFPAPEPGAAAPPRGLVSDWGFREAFPPLVGREAVLERAEAVLAQETERAAVVFAGPSGSGKTALVREMAWRWQARGEDRRAYRVDLPGVMAGTVLGGERGQRMQALYTEALRLGPGALVVLEDAHLATTGIIGGLALCRAVEAGLHLCCTTSMAGLPLLRDPAVRRRLHFIEVPQPEPEELAAEILPAVARHLEYRYGVRIAPESLTVAQVVSARHMGAQPGKVIRVLDSALARARQRGLEVLGPDDVFEAE
jgi:hypothetical protein